MVSRERLRAAFADTLTGVDVKRGSDHNPRKAEWIVDFYIEPPANREYIRSSLLVRGDEIVGGEIRFADLNPVYSEQAGERPFYTRAPLAVLRDVGERMAEVYEDSDPPPTGEVYWQAVPDRETLGLTVSEFRDLDHPRLIPVSDNPVADGSVVLRINDPGGGIHPHIDLRNGTEWMIGPTLDFLDRVADRFVSEWPAVAEF